MAKTYVRKAIDHGTSNSSIAVMEDTGPRIIKPAEQDEDPTMPSAVYIEREGTILIGKPAVRAMQTADPENGKGHTRYKTRLGHDDRYAFLGGVARTGPQLGAMVMGQLLRAYRDDTGEIATSCVITVPAKFEDPACGATREAARLAGLTYCPTLMEPVAASLAYGFSAEDSRAQWLVFDLGGGTLDVSLVVVRDGRMTVLEDGSAGDNNLGGGTFDQELMDYVLGPRRSGPDYETKMRRYRGLDPDYHPLRAQYDLEDFSRPTHHSAWGRLLMAVEMAKIELSTRENAVIEVDGVLCVDASGTSVKVEVPISRKVYEQLIASDVEKAVNVCQTLLGRNRLTPSEVQRLILVGGPTKTPFIQDTLDRRLRIPLEFSIDPMTAVVIGAAIHAETLEDESVIRDPGPARGARITLEYGRESRLQTHQVDGRVDGIDASRGEFYVEIKRSDGLWESGRIPLDADGMMSTEVLLIDGGRNTPVLSRFTTRVFDGTGQVIASTDEPGIWYPYPKGDTSLPSALMVGVEGGLTEVLLQQGVSLPARKTAEFETTGDLDKGSSEDMLVAPVYEAVTHMLGGEDPHADCNVRIGTLTLRGNDIPGNLPGGSLVEVTLRRSRDREITVQASIPLLGIEIEARFETRAEDPDPETMTERLRGLELTVERSRRLQDEFPRDDVGKGLGIIEREDVIRKIRADLDRVAEGDKEAHSKAHRELLRLAGAMNYLKEKQTEARIRHTIRIIKPKVEGKDAEDLEAIEEELEQVVAIGDTRTLARLESQVNDLDYNVRLRPVFRLHDTWELFPQRFSGTKEQQAAFREAEQLLAKLSKAVGEDEDIDDADLRKAEELNEKVRRLWRKELETWEQDRPETPKDRKIELRRRRPRSF